MTFVVDLAHTCDPATSYYSYSALNSNNYYCQCVDSSKPCPTKDLSNDASLYVSLRVSGWLCLSMLGYGFCSVGWACQQNALSHTYVGTFGMRGSCCVWVNF